MRASVVVLMIAACGAKQPTDESVGNRAQAEPVHSAGAEPMIRGTVTGIDAKGPLVGVTILINTDTATPQMKELITLTRKDGTYEQALKPGRYQVSFYYFEHVLRRRGVEVVGTTIVDLQIDENNFHPNGLECTTALASSCRPMM